MRRSIALAKRVCVLNVGTFGILGLGGITLATFFTIENAILYIVILSLICFWWAIIFLMVYGKLNSINLSQIELNLNEWYEALDSTFFHQDFQFQRYVGFILFVTYFHITCGIASNDLDYDFEKYFEFKIIAFGITFIFGGLIQIYFIFCVGFMFYDYKEYQKQECYPFHIQSNIEDDLKYKKKVIKIAIGFCVLAAIYYIIKIGLYAKVSAYNDDKNYTIISVIMILQSVSCLILSVRIAQQLFFIKRTMDVDPASLVRNFECFFGWFILVKSILFSPKHSLWKNIIQILQIVQVIYGLIYFPFFSIYALIDQTIYYEASYVVWDAAVITFFIFWRSCDYLARLLHQVQVRQIVYMDLRVRNNNNQQSSFVFPSEFIGSQQIELPTQSNQSDDLLALRDLGDCCICLDKMSEGQRVSKLKCHESHIFHSQCLYQWRIGHNNCPLCQKIIL